MKGIRVRMLIKDPRGRISMKEEKKDRKKERKNKERKKKRKHKQRIKAMLSIFYGQRIPTNVFFLCRRKKKINKNLLAGCRREIRVIFGRF